jgi:hypothetical protein
MDTPQARRRWPNGRVGGKITMIGNLSDRQPS